MKKPHEAKGGLLILLSLLGVVWLSGFLFPTGAFGVDESVCARVKIEIRQELTLERQAFDAHMGINNGLSHISLEDVKVDVSFADEQGNGVLASSDPNNTSAIFFIRLDAMENIDNVSGSGSVQPSTTADIHWLIIPAPGASKGVPQGTLYYVGATLSYTIGGEEHVTEVTPDYIFVKPMPELVLDYFLPTDVYGDDAFTSPIEAPVPFNLGVRVRNDGAGVARTLKIDSAQPKIVENEQGLLIGFVIEGCEVNGQAVVPSLLADFGDIDPNTSGVARWVMICTLSGQFVEFTADYTHSDELGGELTSLIDAVNTHFLVRDVLVDVAGRDGIRDFLAKDENGYKVYESENVDTDVVDQSGSSSLNSPGNNHTLSTPVTAGFMYVKLSDPHGGQKVLHDVVRSDGKRIKAENAWLSKTRSGSGPWQHYFNLFDANSTGSYSVSFEEAPEQAHAPVLQFIADRIGLEGEQVSFLVEATDADNTTPSLVANPLPAMAAFADQGDGSGVFDWTPAVGQAGAYNVTFRATDGVLEDSQRVALTVRSIYDTDGDGMLDEWELEYFGTLDRDGSKDFDGDGILDLDEFLNGTDPVSSNAPSVPVIFSPQDESEVSVLQPELVVENSTDPDGDSITYEFELYSDPGMTSLVASEVDVAESTATTSWTVSEALNDNSWYHWRVRATDGIGFSEWAYGSFFVNTENEPPGAFQISSPEDDSEVDTQSPLLEVSNSVDGDGDTISYAFEVYGDMSTVSPVASVSGLPPGVAGSTFWPVDVSLDDNTWYTWKAIATDEHGASTETELASFFVNTVNDAPEAPVIASPPLGGEVGVQELDLVVNNALDVDFDTLSYVFELDKVETFDSAELQGSGEILEGTDTTAWPVGSLEDNTAYFWRAKASDGFADSVWAVGSFFVNTANDSPSAPTLKNPGEGAWVETRMPALELIASEDIDNDSIGYAFEVYSDAFFNELVIGGESETTQWPVPSELDDNTWYYWRAQAEDEHGATSGWMDLASFFVNDNGLDDAPQITLVEPSSDILTNGDEILIEWEDDDPDSDAEIALYYDTDMVGEDGTLIVEGLSEDPDEVNDAYLWDISALADGTYTVYATITDGTSSVTVYAQGAVTIDRTAPTVTATPPGGEYNETQYVVLTADEEADICYTVDDTEPTIDSLHYSSPIEVTQDTTIKCMAVDMAGNQGGIVAELYTIVAANEGDLDGDGDMDYDDFLMFLAAFGRCEGQEGYDAQCDYDEDGCITFLDYQLWYGFYRGCRKRRI
jgi:hypothetical protein